MNVRAISYGVGARYDTFSTHTHTPPAARKATIGPHTLIFFLFLQSLSLPFCFLIQSLRLPLSTIQHIPTSPKCTPGFLCYTYAHAPLLYAPQRSLQGAIVTQWGGSVTPASLPSATTPLPSSSCFPSNQLRPSKSSNTHILYTCRAPPDPGQ